MHYNCFWKGGVGEIWVNTFLYKTSSVRKGCVIAERNQIKKVEV